eukprot:4411377-Alexandrium_andersonii.AAC.1
MQRPHGGSASGLGCSGRSRTLGGRHRLEALRVGWPRSSTRARRSRGWHRPGWRRSWSGGASPSAGAGWSGPSWPHAG